MTKILDRIRSWRRKHAEPSTDVDPDPDAKQSWTTVGKTFRASDAAYDKYMSTREDEGRPPH
jgi:hypothetical protein